MITANVKYNIYINLIIFISLFVLSCGRYVSANIDKNGSQVLLEGLLKTEIAKKYVGAKVKLETPVRWLKGGESNQSFSILNANDDGKGNFQFVLKNEENWSESIGVVSFSAEYPVHVAVRRVRPGDLLKKEMFELQNIDASRGMAHEVRGLLFSGNISVMGLECIQTILEGQFLTRNAVQKVPDIRRGDGIQIRLKSGELSLTTSGTAEESGYINNKVKVRTQKSKRELTGLLMSGGVVEVSL